MRENFRGFFKSVLPATIYRKMVLITRDPPVGRVDFGGLRSTRPVSSVWGLDRGQPIDRYYIEKFLTQQTAHIRGHVLEIGTDAYTKRYGGKNIVKSDILHISSQSEQATIVADLRNAPHVDSEQFDCIICTQTLQFIYEVEAAIATLYRLLKPGGALLATFPGISQISRYDMDRWGDFWRFTSASAYRLFSTPSPAADVKVSVYGNVLAATAFLHGLATAELTHNELDEFDPDYEVLVAVCLVKPE